MYCLSFCLEITGCPLVLFLLTIVLSVLLFGDHWFLLSFFFWPLYYLSFCLEITGCPLVLFLLTIVLSVLLFGDHWLSSCPFSFEHCIICPSVWRSLVVLLSVFFWPLYCLSFCLEIAGCPLVLFLLTIVLSVLLFGDHWLSSCPFSFDHCIICPSVWRSLVPLVLFLLTIVLSVLLFGDHWFLLSFFFWPLYYLSFCLEITGSSCPFSFDHCIILPSVWRSLVPLVLFLLTIVLSVLLFGDHWLSYCPFSFDHCIILPSVWRSLVPLVLFLLTIVLSVSLWFSTSECPFGIFTLFFFIQCLRFLKSDERIK